MGPKMRKFFSYYRPYLKIFIFDMICAFTAAGISLAFPLLIRYIATDLLPNFSAATVARLLMVGAAMLAMVMVEYSCNFYITFYGHVMGAKMERDLRNELFAHMQKLSFSYYDNQKTGQIMSRITNDLFDIAELYHHGPEDLLISAAKLIGSFIILMTINSRLTLIVFSFVPVMFFLPIITTGRCAGLSGRTGPKWRRLMPGSRIASPGCGWSSPLPMKIWS